MLSRKHRPLGSKKEKESQGVREWTRETKMENRARFPVTRRRGGRLVQGGGKRMIPWRTARWGVQKNSKVFCEGGVVKAQRRTIWLERGGGGRWGGKGENWG